MEQNEKALALLQEYKEGGNRRALNDLVILFLPLVSYYSRKYFTSLQYHPIIEQDDLLSVGNIGILKAIESYDLDRGTVFKYYAARAIKQSIMDFIIMHINTIRSPHNKMISDHKIHKMIEKLEGEHQAEVTQEDIEDSGLFSQNEIEHYYSKTTTSRTPDYFDIAEDEDNDTTNEQLELINKVLPQLSEREQYIIKGFYQLGEYDNKLSLLEVAKELNITKQRASQLKAIAVKKLQELIKKT